MNLVSIGINAWQEEKENWQALTEHVVTSARNTRGGLVLFVPPYAELPFAYYIQQFEVSLETQGYPESEILLHPKQKRADNPADVLEGRPYVWLVLRDVETANVHEPIIKWLDSHGYVRNQEFVRNDISVQTYTLLEVQDDPWLEPSPVVITGTESKLYIPALFNHSEEPMVSTVHIVVAGETLSGIARRYETTVEALVNANNFLNPNRLSVGQHLIIP
jgi:LysM repeat protein